MPWALFLVTALQLVLKRSRNCRLEYVATASQAIEERRDFREL
jgi:hypothetical protein